MRAFLAATGLFLVTPVLAGLGMPEPPKSVQIATIAIQRCGELVGIEAVFTKGDQVYVAAITHTEDNEVLWTRAVVALNNYADAGGKVLVLPLNLNCTRI